MGISCQDVFHTYASFLAVDIAKVNLKGLCYTNHIPACSQFGDVLAYSWYMRYLFKKELVYFLTAILNFSMKILQLI